MKKGIIASVVAGAAVLGATALAPVSSAEAALPCKTAKLIVPWGAGGGTGVIFGLFEKTINASNPATKIKMVTMPGQGGGKGAKEAYKSKPDGCTLFAIHQHLIVNYINGVTDFNWDGFEAVAKLTDTPEIVGAGGHVGYSNLEGMLASAKKRPGQIPTGVSMGATSHFFWILLGHKTGTSYKYVPFQGGTAGRITGMLNKSVELGLINMSAARTQRKDGKLKAFAIAAEKRDPLIPNVPTLKERGVNMNYSLTRGVMLPKGSPKSAVNYWNGIFKAATQNATLQGQLAKKGAALVYAGPSDYATWFAATSKDFIAAAKGVGVGRFK